MHLVTGDLWSEIGQAQLLLVTTNSQVRRDGALVMGRGAARQARDRWPRLPFDLGLAIHQQGDPYGVILAPVLVGWTTRLGAFQVKYHWRDAAHLPLIANSVAKLVELAPSFDRIALNFPGVGNGRLCRAQVLPLLAPLPENVFVYQSSELYDG